MSVVTRRRLLARVSVALLGMAAAVACGSAAPPTATPAPAKPAEVPKPAAPAPTTAPAAAPPTAAPAKPSEAPKPAEPTKPAAAPAAQPAAGTKQATVRLAIIADYDKGIVKELTDQFSAKNPSIQVARVELPPYDGFQEKMLTQLAAGTAPDAMLLLSYWGAVFGKRGSILLPLDDYLKSSGTFSKDAYDKTLLAYSEWNGKLHALPLNTNVQGILFNKEHFEKAGVANVPKTQAEAWTWDQFLAVCDKLHAAKTADYPYGIYGGGPQGRFIHVYQQGRGIVSQDLKTGDLDNPDSHAALELTQMLFQKKYTPGEIWTGTGPVANVQEMFKAAKVSMMHGGQFHITWAKDNLKFPWGATYLQKGKQLTTAPGGEVYAAYAQSKVPAESAAIVQHLAGEEAQKKLNPAIFRVPSLRSLQAPGAIEWPSHKPEMDLFVDHLKVGSAHMLTEYFADGWGKIDSMLRARCAELANGAKPAKQWAQEVNQQITATIKAGD
jgi:ABC-type glycerol-3-phosphate transport system substrate-binding protein